MQLADLIRQQGILARLRTVQFCVSIQAGAPDLHEVDAVRGGRRQLDIQPADRLARGAVLVSLVWGDQENLLALLPVAHRDELQQVGLA